MPRQYDRGESKNDQTCEPKFEPPSPRSGFVQHSAGTQRWRQRRLRRSVFAAAFGLAEVIGGVAQLLAVRRHTIMARQGDTLQKQQRRVAYLLGGLALALWVFAIFGPVPDKWLVKYNKEVVVVLPKTDPRFHDEDLKSRLFAGGAGVVFALFAVLCYQTSRKEL